MAALKARRRTLAGRTGCGLCGVESLAGAVRPARPVPAGGRLSIAALDCACSRLAASQPLHLRTGASHAAAFADWSGALRLVREDVGRHNALDKLVGALGRSRADAAAGFALITSRASVEMVNKTAAAGIPLLAALSAPTGLAARTAEGAGLTLVGFAARGQRWVYAHPERIASACEFAKNAPDQAQVPDLL
jgi:FdhD protein